MTVEKKSLPTIAISACLAGQSVRYDGQHKHMPELMTALNQHFTVLAVCPEMAIGLPAPRNKIQLTHKNKQIRVLNTCYPHEDLTDLLKNYALDFLQQHSVSGFIFQEKSPSCGIENCKLYSETDEFIGYKSGIFAATVIKKMPDLPKCCAIELNDFSAIEAFINQVYTYSNGLLAP